MPPSPPMDSRHGDNSDCGTALHDRMAIANVIADWGMFRDCGRWDLLRRLYARNAIMMTTWFRGDAEEFVARSKTAFERGARAQHLIGNSSITVSNDRAIADTRMTILLRAKIDGAEVDVTCIGRFHDRFVREVGNWRILIRTPVYDKDRIDAVNPGTPLTIDPVVLSRFAAEYRYLAYCQSLAGDTLTPGLPTPGSAEESALYAESVTWLAAGQR